MTLRRSLVLPFLGTFLAALSLHTALSLVLVSRAVSERMDRQMRDLADFLAATPLPLTAESLGYIPRAFGTDVVVRRADGSTLSTLPTETTAAVLAGRGGERRLRVLRQPMRDGEVFVALPAGALAEARWRALWPLLLAGGLGAAAVALVSVAIGRRLARPLELLAAQAAMRPERLEPPPRSPEEVTALVGTLNRLLEEIARAERLAAVGRLAATLAHEIKNPLASMQMTVRVLAERGAPADACARIEREVQRLEANVQGLLDAARPAPPRPETVPLGPVIDHVLALEGPRLEHQRIRWTSAAGELLVRADPEHLHRALWNLVQNAIQAMPQGGTLEIHARENGSGLVRLSVRDTGPGVDPAVAPRLFEPFVTTKAEGAGLGLAAVRRVAEGHGGRAGFESSSSGATFWLELPRG